MDCSDKVQRWFRWEWQISSWNFHLGVVIVSSILLSFTLCSRTNMVFSGTQKVILVIFAEMTILPLWIVAPSPK